MLQGSGTSLKQYTRGTHRVVAPEATLERVRPVMARAGITRVANITGLDRVGLPVVSVCRPNARSLAVSQGKGLDLAAAKASGVMEAIETYHAEHVSLPLKLASWDEMRRTHPVVDVRALPRLSVSTFHPHKPTLWIEGHDLLQDGPCWVPYEMVHTNYSLPLPTGSGSFVMSSNGLASGNDLLEAISHAVCEVVERDANALWSLGGGIRRIDCAVDLESIGPEHSSVLAMLDAAELDVGVWDTTSDIGLPAFQCVVVDRTPNVFRQLYAALGSGCHPVRDVALVRALTEAAQCRLTYIAGARDDGSREFFERARNPERVAAVRAAVDHARSSPGRRFIETPSHWTDSFADDVAWELQRLASAGVRQAVVVDLTQPEFDIPVVRVIIPGLESLHDAPGYAPGTRARAVMERAGA